MGVRMKLSDTFNQRNFIFSLFNLMTKIFLILSCLVQNLKEYLIEIWKKLKPLLQELSTYIIPGITTIIVISWIFLVVFIYLTIDMIKNAMCLARILLLKYILNVELDTYVNTEMLEKMFGKKELKNDHWMESQN
jgi:hypothetical protein